MTSPDPLKPKPETLGFEREAKELASRLFLLCSIECKNPNIGDETKFIALALEAAFSKGEDANFKNMAESCKAEQKQSYVEGWNACKLKAVKVAENYTTPSKDVCGQEDHDVRWCSDCDRVTAIAEVIEQEIRALKPAKGER